MGVETRSRSRSPVSRDRTDDRRRRSRSRSKNRQKSDRQDRQDRFHFCFIVSKSLSNHSGNLSSIGKFQIFFKLIISHIIAHIVC